MTVHLDAASCALPLAGTGSPEALPDAVRRLLGVDGAHVWFFEGATEGTAALLDAWPLRPGARVGVLPSEYYATRDALDAMDDVTVVEWPADDLDLVVMSHVPSQRGVINPVREVRDVPLIVDVAQSAGQVDVRGLPAVAWVGTSRKWLRGPRGIGFVATRADLSILAPEIDRSKHAGLAGAVDRFLADESVITARIAEMGTVARRAVAQLDGWQVHEPLDEPTGMVTFTHPSHDSAEVHRRLLADDIVTSLVPVTRARDMDGPVLRAAFHAYNDEADLDALLSSLSST